MLPVRIVLRDLAARGLPDPGKAASRDTLWKFIEAELGENLKEFAPHLKKELQEKGGLILLDGLDEVPDANQSQAAGQAGCKRLCRGFSQMPGFGDQPHLRLPETGMEAGRVCRGRAEPVHPAADLASLLERWYAHIGYCAQAESGGAQGQGETSQGAIKGSERLAELAARPLLLTLMASLHAWRGGSLPEKREELYADAVDLLLDQWEGLKVVLTPSASPSCGRKAWPNVSRWIDCRALGA